MRVCAIFRERLLERDRDTLVKSGEKVQEDRDGDRAPVQFMECLVWSSFRLLWASRGTKVMIETVHFVDFVKYMFHVKN